MKQRRILILGASFAVMFMIWSFFHQSEDDVLQIREVVGRITEIHQHRATTPRKPSSNKPRPVVIAVVEIKDSLTAEDGHARVLIRRGDYEVGDEVPLNLKLYKDGSRKVILDAAPTKPQPIDRN